MQIFLHKLQQLHIALHSLSEHHKTFRSEFGFHFKMHLNNYIQLIFLCVVNIIFTFSGIVLNTLAIVSIWKSSQLRKKLCHFMIMVLSCFDLVTIVTNYPGILVHLISWFREDHNLSAKTRKYLHVASIFLTYSALALLVMSIERYLGAYYPIFHRTSVTRRRLLTFLPILLAPTTVMYLISGNDIKIRPTVMLTIVLAIYFPPFLFFNLKLFTIVRKIRRERTVSPGKRTTMNLKNISTALWVVACLGSLYIPNSFYIAFDLAEKSTDTVRLSFIWTFTCVTMNCTLNSLIFFWKNKVLRTEGKKTLKRLKDCLFFKQGLY